MAIQASTLNSASGVGLSAADAGQIASTKDTLNKSFGADSASAPGTSSAAQDDQTSARLSARGRELSAADQRRIQELRRIDAEVRAHEQAHINAGRGVITSGPNYTYTYGPDGKQYAIAGEVGIDTSPEREPEANIDKGQRIQDAALAPRQPSPQDYQVAAVGSQLEAQGRNDLSAQRRAEQIEAASEDAAPPATTEEPANPRLQSYRDFAGGEPGARGFQQIIDVFA